MIGSVGKDVKKMETSHTAGGNVIMQPLWKTIWQFLKRLNTELPYDPAILLLSLYLREMKIYVHTKTCTQMFIQVLFIMVKKWKQPKYPSSKMWHSHTMEYYLAIKNE